MGRQETGSVGGGAHVQHNSNFPTFKIMAAGNGGKFLYFAFGSNLLRERLHISNPSAVFKAIARLPAHRLEFNYFSRRWQGAAATIVEADNEEVWGVLWELSIEHLTTLDAQEGVPTVYNRKTVTVEVDGGEEEAFTYFLVKPVEEDRRPSAVYLDVIVRGAKENGLPEEYIEKLQSIEHNGYRGEVGVTINLEDITKIPD